jgi:hypothetical protein
MADAAEALLEETRSLLSQYDKNSGAGTMTMIFERHARIDVAVLYNTRQQRSVERVSSLLELFVVDWDEL